MFDLPSSRELHRLLSTRRLAIRVASGLDRRTRVRLQVDCDTLVARLGRLDRDLDRLSSERRSTVESLDEFRDRLWPIVEWQHGRRPPRLDEEPLPPVVADPVWLYGPALRSVCLTLLRRHGPLCLRDLHALLHRYGFALLTHSPVRVLSDSLGYECEQGRAERVSRGVYRVHPRFRPPRGGFGSEPIGPEPPVLPTRPHDPEPVSGHPAWNDPEPGQTSGSPDDSEPTPGQDP